MQDVLVPWVLKSKSKTKTNSEVAAPEEGEQEETVYHRYYHLFVKDELRELVCSAAESEGYRILDPPAPADGQGSASEPKSGTAKQGGRWMRVKGEGWEADNWWIEAEVGEGVYKPEKASGGSLPPRKPA